MAALVLLAAPMLAFPVVGGHWQSADSADAASRRVSCEGQGRVRVANNDLCTHGPDPVPTGYDISTRVKPLRPQRAAAVSSIPCVGDGVGGPRVEVVYARVATGPDRYDQYKASIQSWAAEVDEVLNLSSAETGGNLHIRFLQDPATCLPTVTNVVLPAGSAGSVEMTIGAMSQAGYRRTDRKYLIFMDANVICGQGTVAPDDQPGAANRNNLGPSYARVDSGCWGAPTAAHELMHNLGGVQMSAPNTSKAFHCTDEYDVMCYSDAPAYPQMRYLCPDANDNLRYDCNHDDYFNASPAPGTYLATHWNVANSVFLVNAANGPAVTVSSARVASGAKTTVAVSGFTANRSVSVTWDGTALTTLTANTLGAASSTLNLPAAPAGEHRIEAFDGSQRAQTTVTVVPGVRVNPGTAGRNESVTVSVSGFDPAAKVKIAWGTSKRARPIATIATDANGAGTASITIPPTAKDGNRTLAARGGTSKATTSVRVLGGTRKR